MKTAPGQEKGKAPETAEIQARMSFSFLDEMATETSLKSEDTEFCGGCQTKSFKKCNPSVRGGPVQVLLWPGGSGGTRGKHRLGGVETRRNPDIPRWEAEGLGPRPLHEEISAS